MRQAGSLIRSAGALRIVPWVIALAIVLVAWLAPLPRLVQGEEVFAQSRLPATKAALASARGDFQQAQASYTTYVKTHDMGALLASVQAAIKNAAADTTDLARRTALRDQAAAVHDYATVLQRYAQAGEAYFAALSNYDDDLMAWTRDLGPASEQLRSATFPFVEHLKLYPKPVGEKDDPPNVTATQVVSQVAALTQHIADLSPDPNPHSSRATHAQTIQAISQDVSDIWASGRSIEYVESLHGDYDQELQTYEEAVQQVSSQSNPTGPTGGRAIIAYGLDALVGLMLAAGVAGIFMSGRTPPEAEDRA